MYDLIGETERKGKRIDLFLWDKAIVHWVL